MAANRWDLKLFDHAAAVARRRVAAAAGDALAEALPPLAPADAPGLEKWLRRCAAPKNDVAGC